MNDYKYIKAIEENIEEDTRLIEKYCALPDIIYKVSVTSDYLKGLKDNNTIDDMTYNNLKKKIQDLSDLARRTCRCENK